MSSRHHHLLTCAALALVFTCSVASAFQAGAFPALLRSQVKPLPQRKSGANTSSQTGGQVFDSSCAGCHGLDGKGGEHAPDIAGSSKVQQLSDAELLHIVRQGIPGTGMPGFQSLKPSEVVTLVAYLRTLQGTRKTVQLSGDPARGRTLFFGKAACSECHMVAGSGGFMASDLSEFGHAHSSDEILSAITNPSQSRDRHARVAVATTQDDKQYTGRIRNEDNFSVQLQSLDGTFHLFSKSDLKNLEVTSQMLMPSDYSSKLSQAELNDIVSYLMGSRKAAKVGAVR